MFVKLNESDIEVVNFFDGRIKVIQDEDSDSYCLIWRRESDGEYQLMWRGNYDAVMKHFVDITGDVLADMEITDEQARVSVLQKMAFPAKV